MDNNFLSGLETLTWQRQDRVEHIVDRLTTAPRKRQSLLESLPFHWYALPSRTRIAIPVRKTEVAIRTVVDCLSDSRDNVRIAAVRALRRPEPYHIVSASPLLSMLNDNCPEVQTNTLRSLIGYGQYRRYGLNAIREFLTSDSKLTRRLAARNLIDLDPSSELLAILFDAATSDPTEFQIWIDGVIAAIRSGVGTKVHIEKLCERLTANQTLFQKPEFFPPQILHELWIDELSEWPDEEDVNWLLEARTRLEQIAADLNDGNPYVNYARFKFETLNGAR